MLSQREQKPGQEKSDTVLLEGHPKQIEGLTDFWEKSVYNEGVAQPLFIGRVGGSHDICGAISEDT